MRLNRKNIYEINIWPGFVDILGTLLIVTIFTVLISTITQIYFNDQLQIKRGEISSLDNEVKKLLYELSEIKVEKKKFKNPTKISQHPLRILKKKITNSLKKTKKSRNLKINLIIFLK